jgi:lipopolysaccharide biosynthesis glycosyltransferase
MKGAFDDAPKLYERINNMTYYRLLLPSILSDCDKCLYLDSDIIVCGDLYELLKIEIDDSYIAGVKAPWYILYADAKSHTTVTSYNEVRNNTAGGGK